jgi:hypothetical protein
MKLLDSVLAVVRLYNGMSVNDIVSFFAQAENGSSSKCDVIDAIHALRRAGSVYLTGKHPYTYVNICR